MADILDAFLNGLLQLFTWKAFALQLAGIAIGFLVGILPGTWRAGHSRLDASFHFLDVPGGGLFISPWDDGRHRHHG